MQKFYLIVTTLLLASLGVLKFATFPYVPVVAPPMSKPIGSADTTESNPVGDFD